MSSVGWCPSCASCTWAFNCPLRPPFVGSATFCALRDIHLFDLSFIPFSFAFPPTLECVPEVVVPFIPAPGGVCCRGVECCGVEKVFLGFCVPIKPGFSQVQAL